MPCLINSFPPPWNGWLPCVPISQPDVNKQFDTMVSKVTSPGEFFIRKLIIPFFPYNLWGYSTNYLIFWWVGLLSSIGNTQFFVELPSNSSRWKHLLSNYILHEKFKARNGAVR